MKMCFYNLIVLSSVIANCGQINSAPVRDFKNLSHLAKKWGETMFHEWAWKKITSSEAVAIGKYTYKDYEKINKYLNETKGILVENNEGLTTKYNVKYLNEKIRLIDSALKKAKIPESIKVYRRVQSSFFGFNNLKLRDQQMNINLNIFNKIKGNFLSKEMIAYNFLSTSLINEPQSSEFHHHDYAILMEIHVHHGINGAYLGDTLAYYKDEREILINRGYNFKYNHFSIIEEFGIESIKVGVEIEPNKLI